MAAYCTDCDVVVMVETVAAVAYDRPAVVADRANMKTLASMPESGRDPEVERNSVGNFAAGLVEGKTDALFYAEKEQPQGFEVLDGMLTLKAEMLNSKQKRQTQKAITADGEM